MEKIKYILQRPTTMLVTVFIIINICAYYNYNIGNIKRKEALRVLEKIEQNRKLKLEEIEKDKIVVSELKGDDFEKYLRLKDIEVKNIENNIKKNRSLKYTIKNNTNNDIYISSETVKRTKQGNVDIPLIDFVGYKKLIKKGEEVQLEINPIEKGYINSMHDVLTKAIYELSREDNLSIKPIGYINIRY